jgi:sec-independent protein translocase protein TatC
MGAEEDVRMPLTAHLEELRTRLIRGMIGAVLGFAACYGFVETIVTFLLEPLHTIQYEGKAVQIIGTGVTDAFFTKLKVAFVSGLFVASPIIFYQAWQFVAPGLYEKERRVALPFAFFASFFFCAGAAFCYWLVFPVAFQFFVDEFRSLTIDPQIRVSEYLSFTSRMLLAFGVTFELPVVTFFLARVGVLTHKTMISWWRYAIVTIFVVAAVLTPGPDIASQMLMATPLLVLYALSIGIAYMVAKPKAESEEEPSKSDEDEDDEADDEREE